MTCMAVCGGEWCAWRAWCPYELGSLELDEMLRHVINMHDVHGVRDGDRNA